MIKATKAAVAGTTRGERTSRRAISSEYMEPIKRRLTTERVTPIPPMPARIPRGIPMSPRMTPSKKTVLRIWPGAAPVEASRPNCFFLSFTEMAKAL